MSSTADTEIISVVKAVATTVDGEVKAAIAKQRTWTLGVDATAVPYYAGQFKLTISGQDEVDKDGNVVYQAGLIVHEVNCNTTQLDMVKSAIESEIKKIKKDNAPAQPPSDPPS